MAFTKFSVLQLQHRLCGLQPASRYIKVIHCALAAAIVIWTIFNWPFNAELSALRSMSLTGVLMAHCGILSQS